MSLNVSHKMMNVRPEAYAAASVLANEVAEQMLARLDWMSLQPNWIVDVGCGVGHSAGLLQKRYPSAAVLALDIAHPMLTYAKQQEVGVNFVCADTVAMPLADHSVDMIFANWILPWCPDMDVVLREWRRVLKPDGLLMFSSLGPDTLQVWRAGLGDVILPDLIDMHHQGDALVKARFIDPVMDVEYVSLRYDSLVVMLTELHACGMICEEGLSLDAVNLPKQEAHWDATFEIVYGHAFGPKFGLEQAADQSGVVKFPLSHLRRRT